MVSIFQLPYRIRSQKWTYPIDTTKKAIVIATNPRSCIFISPCAQCSPHGYSAYFELELKGDKP
jgi:hypothetical protein